MGLAPEKNAAPLFGMLFSLLGVFQHWVKNIDPFGPLVLPEVPEVFVGCLWVFGL